MSTLVPFEPWWTFAFEGALCIHTERYGNFLVTIVRDCPVWLALVDIRAFLFRVSFISRPTLANRLGKVPNASGIDTTFGTFNFVTLLSVSDCVRRTNANILSVRILTCCICMTFVRLERAFVNVLVAQSRVRILLKPGRAFAQESAGNVDARFHPDGDAIPSHIRVLFNVGTQDVCGENDLVKWH